MDIKPQDLFFTIVLVILLIKPDPKYFTIAGLISITASIPLFYFWIFFSAQRLILYAFVFIIIAVLLNLWKIGDNKSAR